MQAACILQFNGFHSCFPFKRRILSPRKVRKMAYFALNIQFYAPLNDDEEMIYFTILKCDLKLNSFVLIKRQTRTKIFQHKLFSFSKE